MNERTEVFYACFYFRGWTALPQPDKVVAIKVGWI